MLNVMCGASAFGLRLRQVAGLGLLVIACGSEKARRAARAMIKTKCGLCDLDIEFQRALSLIRVIEAASTLERERIENGTSTKKKE